MQRSDERILTTHAGSLPRPPALTRLLAQRERGEAVDAAALEEASRAALSAVVAKQRTAGVDIGNDGEQRRESFFLHLRHRLSGIGGAWQRSPRADIERYPAFKQAFERQAAGKEAVGSFAPPKAVGEVRHLGAAPVQRECAELRALIEESGAGFAEAFVTAPSPGIVAAAIRNEHYASDDAYLAALGAALRIEYEAIAASGFLLQLDCPELALERHVSFQDRPLGDFLGFAERVVDTINGALDGIPRERVRMHVCWGNYEAPHDCDVPLPEILPILRRAKVGALMLPFANPRHAHEVRYLEQGLGEDQLVVAGVIDTLTNVVEHPEVVAERIERVARLLGDPRRVIAGTDCGFDTSAGMGRVAEDVAWAKLAALRDGARLASRRLLGE
jgi:5-methyltetrahydropteroyltriglutamate--homocysteine methyltransferase